MKKITTFLLLIAMLAGMCVGCDDNKAPVDGTTAEPAKTTEVSESVTETATAAITTETVTTVTTDTEAVTAATETTPLETEPEYTEGLFMIDYAETILGNYSEYDEYVIDDTAPAIKAVIYTDGVVKDLKFYSLTNPSVDENGRMSFDKTELYSHKYITKDRPILITFTSYGTIPTYGVSVTDAVGDTVCFAITMNGEDGSLLLTEIG
ncbi:MAG: hypothetical protein J6L96_00450 [Clostridia bacterium]|nr:hypothetical protein [Clostridia bacterium]